MLSLPDIVSELCNFLRQRNEPLFHNILTTQWSSQLYGEFFRPSCWFISTEGQVGQCENTEGGCGNIFWPGWCDSLQDEKMYHKLKKKNYFWDRRRRQEQQECLVCGCIIDRNDRKWHYRKGLCCFDRHHVVNIFLWNFWCHVLHPSSQFQDIVRSACMKKKSNTPDKLA